MPPALHLSRLPAPQREAWRRLTPTREDFVLYGGTAAALHAAHRESVDFDFFSSLPLDGDGKRALRRRLDLDGAPVTQDKKNTLGIRLDTDAGPVLLSFFGGLPHPRLEPPLAAADGPRVASRLDLAGFKAAMTYRRHEENDAADLAALLAAGESLPRALAAMQAFYPEPELLPRVVAALTWFDKRTPSPQGALTDERRRLLEQAAADWNGELPEVAADAPGLGDPGFREAVLR